MPALSQEDKDFYAHEVKRILAPLLLVDPDLGSTILLAALVNYTLLHLGTVPKDHDELASKFYDELGDFLLSKIKEYGEVLR